MLKLEPVAQIVRVPVDELKKLKVEKERQV